MMRFPTTASTGSPAGSSEAANSRAWVMGAVSAVVTITINRLIGTQAARRPSAPPAGRIPHTFPEKLFDESLHIAKADAGRAAARNRERARRRCRAAKSHHLKTAQQASARAPQQRNSARVEQVEEAAWRVEKINRLTRRRRIEDDQIRVGREMQLRHSLLHRHVVADAGKRIREVAVDAIREDGVARGRRGRMGIRSTSKVAWEIKTERAQARA